MQTFYNTTIILIRVVRGLLRADVKIIKPQVVVTNKNETNNDMPGSANLMASKAAISPVS